MHNQQKKLFGTYLTYSLTLKKAPLRPWNVSELLLGHTTLYPEREDSLSYWNTVCSNRAVTFPSKENMCFCWITLLNFMCSYFKLFYLTWIRDKYFWRYSVLILKKHAFLKRAWVYIDFMSPYLSSRRRYCNGNIRQIRDITVTSWFKILSFIRNRLLKRSLLRLMQLNQYGMVSVIQFEAIQPL